MNAPDPELDTVLDRFCRRARALERGRLTISIEKDEHMLVDHQVEQGQLLREVLGLMQEVPCKREAEAEAKKGRRR